MPGLELPSQYQAIHHAGREGGRRERRKIMYNTNKVSPPAFIPNQFLVKEPNPEGSWGGGWEGGYALGRNLVTRCTPVNRDKSHHLHSSPSAKPPLATSAGGSSTGARLQPAGLVSLCSWGWGRTPAGTAVLGKGRGEHQGASPASTAWRGQASACKQHQLFPRCCHNHFGGP